jgi:hypothetical protein
MRLSLLLKVRSFTDVSLRRSMENAYFGMGILVVFTCVKLATSKLFNIFSALVLADNFIAMAGIGVCLRSHHFNPF